MVVAVLVGLIDGTQIDIAPPAEFEEQYVNRHHSHSINAILVGGYDYKLV